VRFSITAIASSSSGAEMAAIDLGVHRRIACGEGPSAILHAVIQHQRGHIGGISMTTDMVRGSIQEDSRYPCPKTFL